MLGGAQTGADADAHAHGYPDADPYNHPDAHGAHNGAYKGGVTRGQPGAIANDPNASAGFDGSSGYVDVPYSGALNPSGAFSVEV